MFEETDMVCEIHPLKEWPHDDCPGPGCPMKYGIEWAKETIIWMSGSDDFSPEGKAHEGWKKIREML